MVSKYPNVFQPCLPLVAIGCDIVIHYWVGWQLGDKLHQVEHKKMLFFISLDVLYFRKVKYCHVLQETLLPLSAFNKFRAIVPALSTDDNNEDVKAETEKTAWW